VLAGILWLILTRWQAGPSSQTASDQPSFAPQSPTDQAAVTPQLTVPAPAGSIILSARNPDAVARGLTVNPLLKENSLTFYREQYLLPEGLDVVWSGEHATCAEGTTAPAFRDAVLQRVNYFRAMAGVPADIVFWDEFNQKAQKAALLLSANNRISHTPDPSWYCYSAEGAEAAENSNLFLGVFGWRAVDGYIEDGGSDNYWLPHRRLLLEPRAVSMGSGDIPPASGFPGANALWVLGAWSAERPATRETFVAWPPPGYVPYQVVFPRWSFAYPKANFSEASVSMSYQGQDVALDVLPVVGHYVDNTLVWEPQMAFAVAPAEDQWYTVQIRNVVINGQINHFSYVVILFDPGS
jgi:hypothetical protein